MWKAAIEDAVVKTKANIERYQGKFPHVSERGAYHLNENTEWTDGFWAGILWLCYEYTGDEQFREAGRKATDSFRRRLDNHVQMDHHDIGFLYILSSKAQWLIQQDDAARQLTLESAEALMERWREKPQLIQAWGAEGDRDNGGRIIIDCLLNLPLLFWAYEQTEDQRFYDAAVAHADKSRRYLVRGDASSYHTFYFDQETGEPLRGGTHQGYSDGSTWTRGQAWGVYGFALSYRYTKNEEYLDTALRMAIYFLKRLPEDDVTYWDFDAPVTLDTKRDSSASAITASGILELLQHLPVNHPDREFLQEGVDRMMKSLVANYSTMSEPDAQGLINRGSYNVNKGVSPDDPVIWGDYYYLEALMRLERGHKGYW
jgi:unsaturated chondroitin disaccharide hydrolase